MIIGPPLPPFNRRPGRGGVGGLSEKQIEIRQEGIEAQMRTCETYLAAMAMAIAFLSGLAIVCVVMLVSAFFLDRAIPDSARARSFKETMVYLAKIRPTEVPPAPRKAPPRR